jgi:hypothetical protein
VLSLLNRRIAALSLGVCFMTSMSANAGLLPDRVEKAAQERIAAGTYETLVFGVVDGDKSEVLLERFTIRTISGLQLPSNRTDPSLVGPRPVLRLARA